MSGFGGPGTAGQVQQQDSHAVPAALPYRRRRALVHEGVAVAGGGGRLPLVENGSGVRRLAAGFFVHSVHYYAVVGMFGGFCNRRWCVMRMSSGTAMSLTTHKPSGDSEQRRE